MSSNVSANCTPFGDNLSCDFIACPPFPDDPQKCQIIIAVKRGVASFSLFGCLFMIFTIWLFKKYSVFSHRLILYLTIAAFMDSIAYLMGELHPDGPLCDFQAFWLTYFDWVVLLWVLAVTTNLFLTIVTSIRSEKHEWMYHMVSWIVPLGISLLPFMNDHYGPAGAWCWIKHGDTAWRFGIWYIPLFVLIFLLLIVYSYIIYKIKKQVRSWQGMYDPDMEANKRNLSENVKPLIGYPLVYLFLSLFPLINRIQNAVNPQADFALMILHVISSPLQGAANAVVFGLDKETMSRLRPHQIRMALRNRFCGQRTVIAEYASFESPMINVNADKGSSHLSSISSLDPSTSLIWQPSPQAGGVPRA